LSSCAGCKPGRAIAAQLQSRTSTKPEASDNPAIPTPLAALAGLAALLAVVVADIAMTETGWMGMRSEVPAYLGLVLASFIGGAITAAMTPNKWARGAFIIVGALGFLVLAKVEALWSEGNPDTTLAWAPVWHVMAGLASFAVIYVSTAKARVYLILGLLASAITASGIYGMLDRARYREDLRAYVKANSEAAEKLWMPRIFTHPPTITWGQPSFTQLFFEQSGALSGGKGSIKLHGYQLLADADFTLTPSDDFPSLTNEDNDHFRRRATKYLRAEGFADEILQRLIVNEHGEGLVSELDDVPIDATDPTQGKHSITVFFDLQPKSITLLLQPGPQVK
jgi:hypothetical protein